MFRQKLFPVGIRAHLGSKLPVLKPARLRWLEERMVSLKQKADYRQPRKLEFIPSVVVLLCTAGQLQNQEHARPFWFLKRQNQVIGLALITMPLFCNKCPLTPQGSRVDTYLMFARN